MKGKRYTDEFKKEAVKQVTERGYSVSEVADRLGTTTPSLYLWLKKFGEASPRQADKDDLATENARLKADLKRMTEECDIRKKAAIDSTGHCNRYSEKLICRGSMDETYVYRRREELCFRSVEARCWIQ
jgi:transposase